MATDNTVTSPPVEAVKSGVQSGLNLCFDRWKSFVTFAHPYVDTAKEKLEKTITCVAFPGCESLYNRGEEWWKWSVDSVKGLDEKYSVKSSSVDALNKFLDIVWLPLTLILNLHSQLWSKCVEVKDNIAPTMQQYWDDYVWAKVSTDRQQQLTKLSNGAFGFAKHGYDTVSYEVNGLRKGELSAKDVWNDSIGGFANLLSVGLDKLGNDGYYATALNKFQVFKLLQKVKFSDPENHKKMD